MALMANKEYIDFIDDFIKSEEFSTFKKEIEEKFGITCLDYEINIKDMAFEYDGYAKIETKARTIFIDDYSNVKEIIFYNKSIEKFIKDKFYKLEHDELVFQEIIKLYIKYILVHELVHVYQFKLGKLTKEIADKENLLEYRDRELEIEANEIAKSTISNLGELEKQLIKFYDKQNIDNNDVEKILKIVNKK